MSPLLKFSLVALVLWASCSAAHAEPQRELSPSVGAAYVQTGEAYLLTPSGEVEGSSTRLVAGVFYTLPGHQRLTAAFSQVQAERLMAQARVSALERELRPAAPAATGAHPGATAVVGLVALLFGGVVGYYLRG